MAEPLHDEFSRLLANFVARSDTTSAVATQANAAVMPTHGMAASPQHQAESSADLAAGPGVQAQASPSAHPELSSDPEAIINPEESSKPEASSSDPQARSSFDKDGRDDLLNALFRCPITKVHRAAHVWHGVAWSSTAYCNFSRSSLLCSA